VRSLDPIESAHAVRALRMKPGDKFETTDGRGNFYHCIVTEIKRGECSFDVEGTDAVAKPATEIHIALAPTKNIDRVEWFVEKATEVGVDRISFIACDHSERRNINEDRLRKIAISALKQSLKAWLPIVGPLIPFEEILDSTGDKFIAHLDDPPSPHLFDRASKGKSATILIGPEGDFSPAEVAAAVAKGFQTITLGTQRLRTETAALVAAHSLALKFR
jgi:16S rRNA (uracil1498-N3)-methyltransferase